MELRYVPESGFVARGGQGPLQAASRDWIVWHFTHIDNLASIAAAGRLLPSSRTVPVRNVANTGIKERRDTRPVDPDDGYPTSTVGEHVPFYIAAKSPMLFVVTRGHDEYRGGNQDIVFLGAALGDIIDSGATWCVSNGNAAAMITKFSRDVPSIGTFVDFAVLRQRDWYNTPDDTNRKSRRAAEALVLGEVPLELITVVVAKTERALGVARAALASVRGQRQYHVVPEIYY